MERRSRHRRHPAPQRSYLDHLCVVVVGLIVVATVLTVIQKMTDAAGQRMANPSGIARTPAINSHVAGRHEYVEIKQVAASMPEPAAVRLQQVKAQSVSVLSFVVMLFIVSTTLTQVLNLGGGGERTKLIWDSEGRDVEASAQDELSYGGLLL